MAYSYLLYRIKRLKRNDVDQRIFFFSSEPVVNDTLDFCLVSSVLLYAGDQ